MHTLIIISLLLLSSCGVPFLEELVDVKKDEGSKKYHSTNPTFQTFKNQFKDMYYEIHGKDINLNHIPINFDDTRKETFAGVCIMYPNGDREIFINSKQWNRLHIFAKRSLIFHELGHCYLNLGHDNHKHNNFKTSYMNEYIVTSYLNEESEFAYDYELMTKNKNLIINFLFLILNL